MRRSFILICVALLLSAFANAQSYDITVNITGNGNVVYNDAAVQNAEVITVDENATPAFTITAATGSHVASVILDIANEGGTNVTSQLVDNVYTFAAVTANHTLDVTFEADPVPTYTITLNVTGNGTVTPNGENNVVTVDENETLHPLSVSAHQLSVPGQTASYPPVASTPSSVLPPKEPQDTTTNYVGTV